jgi:site-specific DNA recombinase
MPLTALRVPVSVYFGQSAAMPFASAGPDDPARFCRRLLTATIWGQQSVEREPSTGRKLMRPRPRSEWKVVERPEMRIISDELWERTQATRKELREAVASKGGLGRGKSGKHYSRHLFSGFARCGECGGAITSVSGGKGSPRFGCAKSWQNGTSSCSNRLTIRIKVAEPQILAKLQAELLKPQSLAYITERLEKEIKKSTTAPADGAVLQRRLEHEKRKLQNLLRALEDGATAPATVLKAIAEKEKAIAELEVQVRAVGAPRTTPKIADAEGWVRTQLADLAGLLHDDVSTVKAEFRRLNLALTFTPTDAEPRPHYVVKGQCDFERTGLFFCLAR